MYHRKWTVAAATFGIAASCTDGQKLQDSIAETVVTRTCTTQLLKNARAD
ncbi:MAG: hypothetical protein NC206_05835 [Bacteroides sp.]|nr:hypothetical protein [Roseburia sp.]MCM1346587.1 hypothetical protein [Bacteroides sp.]MCM1421399.1 hypothetical protein [Bacteroides sp.]